MPRTSPLFSPYHLAAIDLPNRIVMAPLTRDRAGPGDVPTAPWPNIMPSAPAPA